MDLSSAFLKYPIFRIFRPSDEESIHAMLSETPMHVGSMELIYDRRPLFRGQLDYQAAHHITTVADVGGEIRGFGSYSWGKRLVGGRTTHAMYIGDFRVKRDRRVAVGWRACYPNLLKIFGTDPEFGPCEWIYTGILSDNIAARRSLTENRASNGFYYHPVADFAMVNTFFRPVHPFRKYTDARLVRGNEVGESKLREFLDQANRALFLGYDFGPGPENEWDRRRNAWPGFTADRFFVWLDPNGNILACTLPWSPSEAKRMRVNRLGRGAGLFFRLMSGLGFRAPKLGKPFKTLYLTHLVFRPGLDRNIQAKAIAAFIEEAFRLPDIGEYHMVSYGDPSGLRHLIPLRNPLTQVTGVELFLVTLSAAPPILPPHDGVAFEMALV